MDTVQAYSKQAVIDFYVSTLRRVGNANSVHWVAAKPVLAQDLEKTLH